MDSSDSSNKGIRCFLALDISPAVRERVADLIERLKKGIQFTGAHPAWVRPENIHLTLHFLGDVEPGRIEAIKPDLDAVASRIPAPELKVEKLGCFPNDRSPKVLWMGIPKPDRSLFDLHERLALIVHQLGKRMDKRAYHPHLTLARIKSLRGVRGMRAWWSRIDGSPRDPAGRRN